MRAAVWHGYKDVRVEDRPEPVTPPGYVKVRVDYAGICGTDRHEYVGPNFIPVEKPHRLTGKTAPLTMGHEFSGEIVEVGEDVIGYQVGDRVTANGTFACGKCDTCKSGRYNVCEKLGFLGVSDDGVFADYVCVQAERLFIIPETVTQRQALLAEPLACGIHATNLIGDMTGKRVVVIGCGIIGLSCFFAAYIAGAKEIMVTGMGDYRKELVQQYGGTYVDTKEKELSQVIADWGNGGQADVVYECVGAETTLNQAIAATRPGGKVMIMGVFEKKPVIDMNLLQEGERTLLTSQAHVGEIAAALYAIETKKIDADALITKEIPLERIVEDGFEELIAHGPEHIKVAVKIH